MKKLGRNTNRSLAINPEDMNKYVVPIDVFWKIKHQLDGNVFHDTEADEVLVVQVVPSRKVKELLEANNIYTDASEVSTGEEQGGAVQDTGQTEAGLPDAVPSKGQDI